MSSIVGAPSKLINDNDVDWVINLEDGTSVAGVRYIDPKTKKERIRREAITRKEGERLALFLERRDKARGKLTNA